MIGVGTAIIFIRSPIVINSAWGLLLVNSLRWRKCDGHEFMMMNSTWVQI